MQYPQTRYQDTISPGINSSQLTLTVGLTPPTRTQGILTIGRLQTNTEDVLYNGIAGNVVTITLRGLSQTALTPTTVGANQKVHNTNESLEITTHHNYDTDLLRKTENDTVTGLVLFQNGLKTPNLQDINGVASITTPAAVSAVNGLEVDNSATGVNVIAKAIGSDSNITLELQGKGTGVVIVPDGSANKTSAAPTLNAQLANKLYVDTQVATLGSQTALYAPLTDVYGEGITAPALVYQKNSDQRWYNVTANPATQNGVPLGLAIDSGTLGQSNKRVLRQGAVTGLSFPNINPTFSNTGTGTNTAVGDTTNSMVAGLIDNTSGAEAVVTGGTVSARQTGSAGGNMGVALVLSQVDQATPVNTPACFWDNTNHLARGAVVATATISQLLFSGTYQNLAFSFGANVKIPAGCRAYLVFYLIGAASGTNFYQIQSSGTLQVQTVATNSTWTNNPAACNYTLTVVSTSSVGYSVKAFTSGIGSFGLTPSNPWAKVIGLVTSSTTMTFNPTPNFSQFGYGGAAFSTATPVVQSGIDTIVLPFCPSKADFVVSSSNNATASGTFLQEGVIDSSTTGTNAVNSPSNLSYIGVNATSGTSTLVTLLLNGVGSATNLPASTSQNILYANRLEQGAYVYTGYPTGNNFVSIGAAGFSTFTYRYKLIATV